MITKLGAAAWKEFFHSLNPENQKKLFVNSLCNKIGISREAYSKLPKEVQDALNAKILKEESMGINKGTQNILARNNGIEIPVSGEIGDELKWGLLGQGGGYVTLKPGSINELLNNPNYSDMTKNFISNLSKNKNTAGKYITLRNLKADDGVEIPKMLADTRGYDFAEGAKVNPYTDALLRRHEAYEVAAANKHNTPLDPYDMSGIYNKDTGALVGAHIDPSVLVNEARLINNSPIPEIRNLQNTRIGTGEDALLNSSGAFRNDVYHTQGGPSRFRNKDYVRAAKKIKPSTREVLDGSIQIPSLDVNEVAANPSFKVYLAG